MKARQSINRNLEREDAALLREQRHQEQLLYGDQSSEPPQPYEEDDDVDEHMHIGDIAGDVTITVPPQSEAKSSLLKLLGIPLLTLLTGGIGGAGIAALVTELLQSDPPAAVSTVEDTDTIGVLELDRE